MPGLYINDPGATSSLGNILGGLAENLSPQGQARAQLIYQQTGQADVARQQALDVLEARRAAMARVQQWRQVHGANAGGDGSVAGTAASLAAPPPLAFTPNSTATPDLSTFTPDATMDAARIAQGDFGTAEQAGSINLGQNVTRGPGMTDQAIATRSTMPLSPGQVVNPTGLPPAGSTTMTGGSEYTHAGDVASGTADIGLANQDLETGNAAKANLGKVNPLLDLFNTVVAPASNVGGKLAGDIKEKLAAYFGVSPAQFDDVAAARELIRKQLLTFVGGLRDSAGQPFSPRQTQLILDQIPDPAIDPVGFRSSMEWVRSHLQAQASNAEAAQHFIETRQADPGAGPRYHSQRGTNAGEEGRAYAASGLRGVGDSEPPAAPAPPKLPPGTVLKAPGPGDVADAKRILADAIKTDPNNGPKVRQQLIDHARAKGVDLELGGF